MIESIARVAGFTVLATVFYVSLSGAKGRWVGVQEIGGLMKRIRAILATTVRIAGWFSLPTVLFLAAIGPFVWGLYLVAEPLAWVIPSGAVLALAVWQSLGRPKRGSR